MDWIFAILIGVFACVLAVFIGSLVGLISLFACSVLPTVLVSTILSAAGVKCGFGSRLGLIIWWGSYFAIACLFIYLHVQTPYSSRVSVLQNSWVQIIVKAMFSVGVLSIPHCFFLTIWRAGNQKERE